MTRAYLAFTDTGLALARRLADALPGSVDRCGSGGVSLAGWTALQFAQSDALVFVGAVGIAVRAIAPHCRSKASDPAVVVLDECGRFAVPVLSGHLGGANDLARALAAVCGAVPVITTATDAHGIFAVDEWAKHQNCTVLEAERIKHVSSKLLAGQSVRFAAEFPVQGTPPAGVDPARTPAEADFALTLSPAGDALHLVPHIGVLGIGCRRGTCAEQLEAAFADFCARHSLAPACIVAAASIDLKADEAGLLAFCRAHGWPITFYSAEQLRALSGPFTPSPRTARCWKRSASSMSAASCWPGSRCGLPLSFPCRAPRPPGWILHGPLPKPILPLPSPLPGTLCIWCPTSGCWASAAAEGHVPSSWKPPLLTSAPGTALPRRASWRRPAST